MCACFKPLFFFSLYLSLYLLLYRLACATAAFHRSSPSVLWHTHTHTHSLSLSRSLTPLFLSLSFSLPSSFLFLFLPSSTQSNSMPPPRLKTRYGSNKRVHSSAHFSFSCVVLAWFCACERIHVAFLPVFVHLLVTSPSLRHLSCNAVRVRPFLRRAVTTAFSSTLSARSLAARSGAHALYSRLTRQIVLVVVFFPSFPSLPFPSLSL